MHYNSRLITSAVREGGLFSPLIEASTQLFEAAESMGHGDKDMVAVVEALARQTPAR